MSADNSHNPFWDAYWAELQKLPTPAALQDWYIPHNQFSDAWAMYCSGGEL